MRFSLIFAALALAACTSKEAPTVADRGADSVPDAVATVPFASPAAARSARTIANLPDRGRFVAYAGTEPVRRTAYTWYPAALSESHALRAIATGTMEFETPEGAPVRLRYARHIEHADGNWTWIGRPDGAQPGTEAIITFGDKAVFGSVPNGDGPPLRITTTNGRTWVMATDPRALRRMVAAGRTPQGDDFAVAPALAGARDKVLTQAAIAPQKLTASGAVPESATVDVAIGYTSTFASRLGGTSQALTRLRYLVDTANTAFANSQIVGAVRLAGTVSVNYPDATSNDAALDALTGVTCTDTDCEEAPIPAALQPIHTLRESVGADLISLVRNFSDPENESCGIAWLLGSGQDPITQDMAYAGASVVSDSNGNQFPENDFICRDETFVHELAHNMGSAHDEANAQGDDGTTDPEDYGRYPYSFGYKTTAGNFYTIMAYRDEGQQPYRVFSNPRITYCGGSPCGVADKSDNARSLGQTMPVVAQFYIAIGGPKRRADFDGDGRSDLWWRNGSSGANVIFRAATQGQNMAAAAVSWRVSGLGDFDGDGRADVLWRNATSGANAIWRSGNSATPSPVSTVADAKWHVAGTGDFDGNGRDDVLWRNSGTGANTIWLSGNSATTRAVATAPIAFAVAGVDDYNGDGIADILWRRSSDGVNVIWRSGQSTSVQAVTAAPVAWRIVGSGDFDGDGKADILWRNSQTGQNTIWRSGVSTTGRAVATVAAQAWTVGAVADYNGDGQADIFWRNTQTGQNVVWRSALSTATTAVPSVALAWTAAR